ncbi:hypothetical protein [Nocardioides marmoribigeumensis]|uniref:DUF222 domain-containing protein n=1 Tax=Nocardioides marmoribigeumensis TaxID=433649 RepID=A0ABU2BZ70_9ACTN|nr:hypothetical protein [Nocardioides marmoribigeumensis]MDR7363689.1 hypothetical protein [Nocardioides marmoribigeumensis]
MSIDLREATPAGLLAQAHDAARARRLAEVADLEVLAQWAAIHDTDPLEGLSPHEQDHARRIGKVLRQVGGPGTPGVQDFCLGEIAIARGAGQTATRHTMADVLDLIHRLPLTWAVLQTGDAEPWVACKIATLSRHLPADRVWVVDQAVARAIAHESVWRTLDLARAKIVEADPAAHEQTREQAEQTRFATVGQSEDDGTRMVVAKVSAADGAGLEAMIEAIAAHVLTTHLDTTLDERRSIALGYFGRLGQLLLLLLTGLATTTPPTDPADPGDPTEDPGENPGEVARAFAIPAEVLQLLRDPAIASRIAPQAVLYVHLHETTLLTGEGVARVEGFGAMTLSQLQVLLAGHTVTVKPVIDLSDRVRTTAYEHPETLKERVHLVTGGDYWPYATSTARTVDYDHPTPYRPGAPPDDPPQTGTHNSGPLGRRHHRWKTHAGYRARQCGAGRYLWQTPHGLTYLVDHRGTRTIDPDHARQMFHAGDGIELYFPEQPLTIEIDLDP